MEKFYIVTNEKYLNQLEERDKMNKDRNVFITKFFKDNDVEGTSYILHGSGGVGCAFLERQKKEIGVYIEDTESNNEKFGKHFFKGTMEGLRKLKKSSPLLKKLQDKCIEEKVVVNLPRPRVGDNFVEFEFKGYSYIQFKHEDNLYLSISNGDVNTITPKVDGFTEIKGSEFYKAKEDYEKGGKK